MPGTAPRGDLPVPLVRHHRKPGTTAGNRGRRRGRPEGGVEASRRPTTSLMEHSAHGDAAQPAGRRVADDWPETERRRQRPVHVRIGGRLRVGCHGAIGARSSQRPDGRGDVPGDTGAVPVRNGRDGQLLPGLGLHGRSIGRGGVALQPDGDAGGGGDSCLHRIGCGRTSCTPRDHHQALFASGLPTRTVGGSAGHRCGHRDDVGGTRRDGRFREH